MANSVIHVDTSRDPKVVICCFGCSHLETSRLERDNASLVVSAAYTIKGTTERSEPHLGCGAAKSNMAFVVRFMNHLEEKYADSPLVFITSEKGVTETLDIHLALQKRRDGKNGAGKPAEAFDDFLKLEKSIERRRGGGNELKVMLASNADRELQGFCLTSSEHASKWRIQAAEDGSYAAKVDKFDDEVRNGLTFQN